MQIIKTTIKGEVVKVNIKQMMIPVELIFHNAEPGAEDTFTLNFHYTDIDDGKEKLLDFVTFNEALTMYHDRSCFAFDFINFVNDCISEGSSEIKEGFTDVFDGLYNYIDNVVDEIMRDYGLVEEE